MPRDDFECLGVSTEGCEYLWIFTEVHRPLGHSENKILTSFSKSRNEIRPAVIAAINFSEKFCRLDLQHTQSL